MIVVVGDCSGLSLIAIKLVGGEGAIEIVEDFSFEAVHEEFVAIDVVEGDVGDVDLLGSVGEEIGIIAVGAGLNGMSLDWVVVEPDVIDADVA